MIIDTHYHMMLEVSAPDLAKGDTIKQILKLTRKIGKKIAVEEIIRRAVERWPDPDGEKLIASMEEAGVDSHVSAISMPCLWGSHRKWSRNRTRLSVGLHSGIRVE